MQPRHRRWFATRLLLALVALQGTLLLGMAFTDRWPRSRMSLFELLWAAAHKPLCYVFVALFTAGPALTILGWRVSREHRGWFVAAWVGFFALLLTWFYDETQLILRVLHWAWHNQ